jgi:hypothetical protein
MCGRCAVRIGSTVFRCGEGNIRESLRRMTFGMQEVMPADENPHFASCSNLKAIEDRRGIRTDQYIKGAYACRQRVSAGRTFTFIFTRIHEHVQAARHQESVPSVGMHVCGA